MQISLAAVRRPLYSSEDGPNVVSIETYMVGELKTYSTNTLALLLNMIKGIKRRKPACYDSE